MIISNTYVCYLFLCFNFKKVRLNLSHYMLFWRNLSFWGRVSFRILFTDVESRTVMKQWMLSTAFCVLKIVNFLHSCPFQLNLQPKAIMLSSVKFTWNVVFFHIKCCLPFAPVISICLVENNIQKMKRCWKPDNYQNQ